VSVNGEVLSGPSQIEIRPKPDDPIQILNEAKQRLAEVCLATKRSLEDSTQRTVVGLNIAPNKPAVRQKVEEFFGKTSRAGIVVLRTMEEVGDRAISDIQAAVRNDGKGRCSLGLLG
jgi:hypothetical protein